MSVCRHLGRNQVHIVAIVSLLALLSCYGVSRGDPWQVEEAAQALQSRYISVGRMVEPESGVALYGSTTVRAATPVKAATSWIFEYGSALGVDRPDLRPSGEVALGHARRVFSYRQYLDGLPVEYGAARLIVQRFGREYVVVYAAGSLVDRPASGFAEDTVRSTEAVRLVRSDATYAPLPRWTKPERVVFDASDVRGVGQSVRAWKFSGFEPRLDRFEGYTFFVDASTGALVHVRSEVYNGGIQGVVTGKATPSTLPNGPNNPPVFFALENLSVFADGDAVAESASDGAFAFEIVGGQPVNLTVLLAGPWVDVRNEAGLDLRVSAAASDGDFLELAFNESPTEEATAQVNGALHTVLAHNFYTDRAPEFSGLNVPLNCNVNINDACNAFFTPLGPSINFFRAGQCVNTAYSSVIAHEFGHFIVEKLRLRQGAFGEGFGDALAMLIYDDPIVGRDFAGEGQPVRDYTNPDRMFPCFGEIHGCGEVLGGVWWRINDALQTKLGPVEGLETARQLLVGWSQITVGVRRGRNSATPLTAVEVLTVDDDDADLGNGTPNLEAICGAFVAHGIPCQGLCEALRRVRATCRAGTFDVRATLLSDLPADTEVTLVLDDTQAQTVSINRLGLGLATWPDVTEGDHQVCVADCPDRCTTVTCDP